MAVSTRWCAYKWRFYRQPGGSANPEELFFLYPAQTLAGGISKPGALCLCDQQDQRRYWRSSTWRTFPMPLIRGIGRPIFPALALSSCHNLFHPMNSVAPTSLVAISTAAASLFVDVFLLRPGSPSYAGKSGPVCSHDAYAGVIFCTAPISMPGFLGTRCFPTNEPATLLCASHPAAFTHNCWLSDDGAVLFTTDETGDAPVPPMMSPT